MKFMINELEREPEDFTLELAPGELDYGGEAEQVGPLKAEGRAEVLHEDRGPKDIVTDIRLKGSVRGDFQVPCARCVEPVSMPIRADSTCFSVPRTPTARPANAPSQRRKQKSVII